MKIFQRYAILFNPEVFVNIKYMYIKKTCWINILRRIIELLRWKVENIYCTVINKLLLYVNKTDCMTV